MFRLDPGGQSLFFILFAVKCAAFVSCLVIFMNAFRYDCTTGFNGLFVLCCKVRVFVLVDWSKSLRVKLCVMVVTVLFCHLFGSL